MRYPKTFSILLLAIVGLSEANAQIFRRVQSPGLTTQGPVCPGPSCQTCGPAPALAPAPAPIVQQVKTETEEPIVEVSSARATTPHVRCIFNGSCGSGTICGADRIGAYVVTNAHVVGTQVGRVATVDVVTAAGTVRIRGRIVMAGYSDRTMVDFSILHCEGLTSEKYMPMLKTEPADGPYATIGSPRCVWPQVRKLFNDPRNYGQGLITGLPDAIGGQSGSAIFNSKGQQIALLTWSIGGRCAGQKTSKLWQVATQRNIELADQRIPGMTEVDEPMPESCTRPETQSGIFGEVKAFSVATTTTTNTGPSVANNQTASSIAKIGRLENGIQNMVGSAMEELPIWFDPSPQPTPVDPAPVPPVDEDCHKLTDKEWELIQFLRKQSEQDGEVNQRDWLALFMRLMPIIMELIKAIQQSK